MFLLTYLDVLITTVAASPTFNT